MATVSKKIADDVIAGKYASDGIIKIVQYSNMFGGVSYGLVTKRDDPLRYEKSEACSNCVTYWETQGS